MSSLCNQLNQAIELSKRLHAGQKYGDHDYFSYHIQGVANSLAFLGFSVEHQIVAILHDILEDTSCTISDLEHSFDDCIVQAVVCLTKHYYGKETYHEYIKRCSKNPIASMVKFHDMSFNMLNCVKEGRVGKQNIYLAGMRELQEYVTKYQGVQSD